jgi:O-antigen/teichoic acid export membrane protein
VARSLAAMALDRRVSRNRPTLRRLVGKSAAWSTLDVVLGRLWQFGQGVIVARIVAPRDFGVFAIALVVHMIVVNVSELGVSSALVRDDPARLSISAPTVATLSLATGVILGLVVAVLSTPLASALGSVHAGPAIAVMAINLPLAGLTAVPAAVLKRDFRMDRIFVADMANMVVSAVVVILLALAGWGALALAWSWVLGQVVTTLILLSYRSGRFRPGWNGAEARRLLAFGLPLAGANLLAFLVLNVDYIVVARVLGTVTLGFYLLAFNISGWPTNVFGAVIRSVSLPAFSRLRLEGEAMPAQFARALGLIAAVTVPICFIIGALARPAVVAIYGTRWAPAASALVGLSVLGAGRILLELSGDFLVSLGRTRAVLLAQVPWLVALTATLLVVAPRYGIRGVGWAQGAVVVAVVGPVYAVFLQRAGVRVRDILRALLPAILLGVAAGACAHLVASRVANPFLACAAGAAAGVFIVAIPFLPALARRASSLSAYRAREAPSVLPVDPAEPVAQA